MHQLIVRSSKFSFFLLLILSLPVLIETEIILKWWLGNVPDYTINFIRIMLLISMIDAISNPLVISAHATGKIRLYQIVLGGILLCILPISYITLKLGAAPEAVFIVHFIIVCIAQFVRLWIIRPMIHLSLKYYFREVIVKIVLVFFLSLIFPLILYIILPITWWSFILICSICICGTISAIYIIGLNKQERMFIQQKIQLIKRR